MKALRSFLRDPLVHFLGLGASFFVLYATTGGGASHPERITVTRERTEHLAAMFARTWQRPPTRKELDGLVEDWVRTEIAARQAQALGLDEDDVIRRLLRQKLEFVTEDAGSTVATDDELRSYLAEHPEEFRTPPRFTFRQIFLDSARRKDVAADARVLLARLDAGAVLEGDAGDPLLLVPTELEDASRRDVESIFGTRFGNELATAPLGRWSGPVASGYGLHLVFVERRSKEVVPPLEDIRPAVEREWQHTRRARVLDEAYRRMREHYEVVIEPLHDAPKDRSSGRKARS